MYSEAIGYFFMLTLSSCELSTHVLGLYAALSFLSYIHDSFHASFFSYRFLAHTDCPEKAFSHGLFIAMKQRNWVDTLNFHL